MANSVEEFRLRSTKTSNSSRIPPHNLEAEESLLGAMLLSRDAIAAALEICSIDDFYKPAHSHIFDAICSLYSQGEPVDSVTVADELKRANLLEGIGGPAVLLSLQTNTPAISNASHYAKIVEEHALLRRLISVAGEIAELGYSVSDDVSQAIDQAEALIFNVAQRRIADTLMPLRELLEASLDRLEMLYDRGEAITGVPSGYHDLDERLAGIQPSNLVIVGARPAMGKCISWDTPILDVSSGELYNIEELYKKGCKGNQVSILSLSENSKIETRVISNFVDDGLKEVFEVVTLSGRTVTTTASHPFLTPFGWKKLSELEEKIPIAVPKNIEFFGDIDLDDLEIKHLVEEFLLTDEQTYLTTSSPKSFVKQVEIRFRGAKNIWKLSKQSLLSFIIKIFESTGQYPQMATDNLSLGTYSKALAQLIQHFLVRFSINSHLNKRSSLEKNIFNINSKCNNLDPIYEVVISQDFDKFKNLVLDQNNLEFNNCQDVITKQNDDLEEEIFWDEIASINPKGLSQVYDFVVPVNHNFIAGDIVVHNTSFALGIAAHAALEANTPVLFFSLEMSHLEVTQRLLCSEAKVDATRMRNGKLLEGDWSKISHAIGRLGEAPVYIDDNPNVTVMDIRAKARRLKSREGLGLVIIDYLQLMSGRSRAESRQIEVSEISRGLKILARELNVPVIALSQLSRSLETRADKRPVLADLRESGSLEQDADVVMFIYRDEIYNSESADRGTAEIIISKHRNGPTGTVHLAFLENYTRFANMAHN